jgi:hypothetical protein
MEKWNVHVSLLHKQQQSSSEAENCQEHLIGDLSPAISSVELNHWKT